MSAGGPPFWQRDRKGTGVIVIGVDPHKKTHTAAAVGRAAGEVVGELTVAARERGHEELLLWAGQLDAS
jgi:hypothetical protein